MATVDNPDMASTIMETKSKGKILLEVNMKIIAVETKLVNLFIKAATEKKRAWLDKQKEDRKAERKKVCELSVEFSRKTVSGYELEQGLRLMNLIDH
jgi:hypothetical protein